MIWVIPQTVIHILPPLATWTWTLDPDIEGQVHGADEMMPGYYISVRLAPPVPSTIIRVNVEPAEVRQAYLGGEMENTITRTTESVW